ncbi:MAG: glycerol-3-phosphate acyltransferase, partial [Clostridia bacterium]|nr:glycerol-3-phosphate acyltransferase [Clostridia bacterium]
MNGFGTWNLVSYLIGKLGVEGTPAAIAVTIGGIFLCIVIPYLLGSLNFGVMISQKHYKDDVRTHGSGNAGATNMLRTFGWKAGVLTMAGDMLKAVVAVGLG